MENWYNFLIKIKPNGKAFRSILFSKIFYEVLAYGLQIVKDYAVFHIDDQVWYTNDNFDPEPWERRYQVTPPQDATLPERREYIKSLMLFPQSQNRLSKDYMSQVIEDSGFENIILSYNISGNPIGYLHANDFSDESNYFSIGSLSYNSFIVSGVVTATYYRQLINLIMSLKPLQVVLYDDLEVHYAIALSDSLAWALDDSLAIALTTL